MAKTFAPSERQRRSDPNASKPMLLTNRYRDRTQIAVERHRRSMLKRLRFRPDLQLAAVDDQKVFEMQMKILSIVEDQRRIVDDQGFENRCGNIEKDRRAIFNRHDRA